MISVVVPLHNYARYIVENIESICQQTITDWEIIIVDDCSSDDPLSVIKPYLCNKIKYIRLDENVGYGSAKNTGIRTSQGDYIVVLDSDDMLTKNSLEARINALRDTNKKWIFAKAYEFNDNKPYKFVYKKRKYIRRLKQILKSKNYTDLWENIHAQTVMVHRSIYETIGLYEPKLRSMGDKEMWARIINNVELPFYLPKFVVYYRQHRHQMHRSAFKKKNVQKYTRILESCISKRRNGNLSDAVKL